VGADAELTWEPPHPTDVHLTLAPLRHGEADPTYRVTADGALWRTTRMPEGPATLRLTAAGGRVTARGWGAGAAAAVAAAPRVLGFDDDPTGFEPHPRLHDAHRRARGLRVPRTGRVLEALVPAVVEQRVIGVQAGAAWRGLVRRHGEPAPGPAPAGMVVVPSVAAWREVPSWEWHRAGVDPRRVRTLRACLGVADRLEECAAMDPAAAAARLRAVPGVGVWTAAEVAQRALGDADALSVGDAHLSSLVGHVLFDRRDMTDEQMVAALEPWRPHRYRLVRLIESLGLRTAPRRAPKPAFVDHRGR
jgi:3-methyladenine DNA glycosylase/8-oxoguanine DNA glycosylase